MNSKKNLEPAMLAITWLVILTALWKTAMCTTMMLNIRGDSTSVNYYKAIVIEGSILKSIMSNIFIGPSASFSLKYYGDGFASNITFSRAENGTFLKCWHQANILSVTCELQTIDQCMLTLVNKACCLKRNAFLWNTTAEFLSSPEIKNISLNCGNETHKLELFVYERLQTSTSSSEPDMTFSSSTFKYMTITQIQSEDSHSNSTGLIIGIVVAVILVVVLAIVGVMVWNRKKKQKRSKNNAAIKESRLEISENTRQNNFPNVYHNNANVMPVNVQTPISSLIKDDFKDKQMVNAKSNYSNISSHQTSEGNYFASNYDIPKLQHSTIDENVDKPEYYLTNNEVQQLIEDYTTIDSCGLQTADNTSIDRTDDAGVDYSTIADLVEKPENLQSDNITGNELNVKNPYSVMGNKEKTITNPYNVLPSEPNTSSGYFVLLSEGELAPYSLAKDESMDHGTAVENEKNAQKDLENLTQ